MNHAAIVVGMAPSQQLSQKFHPANKPQCLDMQKALRELMCDGWPPSSFKLTANSTYRAYNDANPAELFKKAANWLDGIRAEKISDKKGDIAYEWLTDQMCRVIFGSNYIERVGLEQEETINLCRRIFAGELVEDNLTQSQREVIQHVEALQHLFSSMIPRGEPMTEELLKETHLVLCKGISITHHNGNTMFTNPAFIAREMHKFVQDFNRDIEDAEKSGCLDPFALAAKYCLQFVQIHPFQDGNGRVCRLILNAILCKYLGVVVPIGEDDTDREDYLGIKKRASEQMEGAGEFATFVLQKATSRIRALKQKLAGKGGSKA